MGWLLPLGPLLFWLLQEPGDQMPLFNANTAHVLTYKTGSMKRKSTREIQGPLELVRGQNAAVVFVMFCPLSISRGWFFMT